MVDHFKKKDEKLLQQFFQKWEELAASNPDKDPNARNYGKSQRRQLVKDFVLKFDTLVMHLAQKARDSWTISGVIPTWSSLFYQRMLITATLLPFEKIDVLLDVTSCYIKYKTEEIKKLETKKRKKDGYEKLMSAANTNLRLAEELEAYLQTHRLDPDSSLIGLRPGKRLLTAVQTENHKRKCAPQYSKDDLLDLIRSWGVLEDKMLIKEVRTFYETVNIHNLNLQKGAVLIVDLAHCQRIINSNSNVPLVQEDGNQTAPKDTRIVFARYDRNNAETRTIFAFIDPAERILAEVATDGVLLIPEEKKENFKSQRHMERMAHNPMDDLLRQLSDDIKKMANDHLTKEEGIDMELLEKTNENETSILSMSRLKQYAIKLKQLSESPSEILLQKVDEHTKKEVTAFLERLNNGEVQIFYPSKQSCSKQLENLSLRMEAIGRINRYLAVCESGLDQIKIETRQIMNGSERGRVDKMVARSHS
eukprot:TRINITY_DN8896_c0_g1_i1.p1 TRINITY_DN8896_c0_g1~~TRINITY_DN8896_c0_g1_i1.p1  ORF type:complete len:478 (+),score=106.34 TRINITY_DN8896_c0_g1_i1:225-1658(+)